MTQGRQGSELAFILTNKRTFRSINQLIDGHHLMAKEGHSFAYEEIGFQLGISIDSFTIYDGFERFFKNMEKFGIINMLEIYKRVLFVKYESKKEENQIN